MAEIVTRFSCGIMLSLLVGTIDFNIGGKKNSKKCGIRDPSVENTFGVVDFSVY